MAKAEKDFRRLFGRVFTVGGMILIAVVIIMLMNTERTEAATINVPGDQPTITDAIINATDWDIINVAAGTYNEHLDINKSLTVQGAGSNLVTINGEHRINASEVYLDGFTFANSDDYTITIDAMGGAISTIEITNCAFDLIGYSGVHIGGDSGSGNLISNVVINYNTFTGPPSMGSNPFKIGGLFGSPASQPVFNLDFVGNNVQYGSIPINLHDASINDIFIDDNIFQNTDGIVYIWGEGTPTGVLINFVFTNNDVDSSNSYGVGIGYPDGTFTPSNFGDGNRINYNSFDNIPGAYGMDAVSNFMGSTIDATQNWWGDSSGPGGTGPGSGSKVSANVDYSPWWRTDYLGDAHLTPWIWGTDDSVQDTIDSALSYDILVVNTGTYNENIATNKILNIVDSTFILQGKAAVLGGGAFYLANTSMILDTLNVLSGGIFGYYDSQSTLYVGEQNIYGKAEWWEARVVSGDITVHDGGTLYVNSSSVEMNCSFVGEFGIQVNTTGTLIALDNGTGRSEITAYDTSYWYFFDVFGTLTASNTNISFGWEIYINSPNSITIGNDVAVFNMQNNGIYMEYTNNSNIFNTDIYNINGYGIYLFDSNRNTFNIIFIDDVAFVGIYIDSSTGNSFSNTHIGPFIVSGTIGFSGIYLENSNSNTFQQTLIQQTNWEGIYLDNSDNNYFNDTRLDGIGGSGIYLFFSDNNYFGTSSLLYNQIYNIMGDGVTVLDSSNNEFYWFDIDTVTGNGNGITIVSLGIGTASDGNLISDCIIRNIDNSGIYLDGSGNQIQWTSIMDCDILDTGLVNWGPGIEMVNAYYTTIDPTYIHEILGSPGIYMDSCWYSTVNDTEIYSIDGAPGIDLYDSHWNTFNRNWLHDIGRGIYVYLSDNNEFYSTDIGTNIFWWNIGGYGIMLDESNLNYLFDTEIEYVDGNGINLYDSGSNDFEWLNMSDIGGIGLHIESVVSSSDYNNITYAIIQSIGNAGIYIDGSSNPIQYTSIFESEILDTGQFVWGPGLSMVGAIYSTIDPIYIHDVINGPGIYLAGSDYNTFQDVEVYNIYNGQGIQLLDSSYNDFVVSTFITNQLYSISDRGISAELSSGWNLFERMEIYTTGGYGMSIIGNSQNNELNDSIIYDTGSDGVYILDADGNIITNNVINDTTDHGINVEFSADTFIYNNNIYSNFGNNIFTGIRLSTVSGNTIVSWNDVYNLYFMGGGVAGISVSGQDVKISNNTIYNLRTLGGGGMTAAVILDSSPNNLVELNYITDISSSDSLAIGVMLVSSDGSDVLSNDISDVYINVIGSGSYGVGIYLNQSDNLQLWNNTVMRCDFAGAILNSIGVDFEENIVTDNHIYGIYMEGSNGAVTNNTITWNGWDYIWSDASASFTWLDATTGTKVTFPPPFFGDDGYATGIPIGFEFNYYGKTYNSINIMTNGWLSFVDFDTWYPDFVPKVGDGYEGVITPFGKDLNVTPGNVYYKTYGSAPNRIFVVEYNQIENSPWIGGGFSKTFEVLFYETTSIIRFQYQAAMDDPVSLGIERPDEITGIGNGALGTKYIDPSIVGPGVALQFAPYKTLNWGGGLYMDGSDVAIINNVISNNGYRGIDNHGSIATWYVSDYGIASNNEIVLLGDVYVLPGASWKMSSLDAWCHNVVVDGVAYIEKSSGSIVSWNLYIDGSVYLNSSSWEFNCSFDNEFGLQINSSGTLITRDNGTGISEITAYNTTNCYFFNVYGTLTSSDTDITYGWEVYINSLNVVTIGNSVLVQSMEANGIHVSGSTNVWINNSWIVGNSWNGMLMDSSSVVNATGSIFNLNGQNGVTLDSGATLSATTCTFNSNIGGSGAVVMGSSTFNATTCNFNNNIGGSGAAIYSSSTFTANTCTFNGNNNLGFAASVSSASLSGCTLSGNVQAGLYADSSTITLNSNAIINNLGGSDVYCINSTIYSTDDTFGHIMLIGCKFIRYTGTSPVSVYGWWIFYNCTGSNSITFQNNVTVQPPGVMVLGNTTLIMDSVTPGMTVALDIYGTLQAQIWDNNPNNIQGVNDVAYYLRAHSGSSFTLTSTYLENVGMSSSNLHETGIWINTNNFVIQNNVIWNNYNGLVFQGILFPASNVSQNVIVGNSANGVYVESSAITLSINFIDNNNDYGIYWHDSFLTPSLIQNTISNNILGGVLLDADFDVIITPGDMRQNTIQLNDVFGLNITAGRDINCQLLASDSNIVDSNIGEGVILFAQRNVDATITADVTNNSGDGYSIYAGMRIITTVYNSLIQNNQGYGIALITANLGIKAYILNNSMVNNGDGAISIDSGGTGNYIEIRGNSIDGNGGAGTPAISLSDVTADISENSITNSGGDGIYCRYSDVSITGNQITQSIANGIYLSYSPAVISGNTIRSNSGGGIYVEYSMPTISNNIIESNNEGTILVSSDGIISGNTIISNNQDGIHLIDSNPTITGNMILSNLDNGIYADPSAPTISGNTIMGSSGYGIYLDQSAGLIVANIISNNNLGGIYSYYSNPEIRNNTILGNNNYGIHIHYYSSPIIQENTVTNNVHGIYVEDYCSPTITDNEINSNSNNGIYIYYYSSATISYNTINTNGLNGIYVEDSTARILNNVIMSNDDYGIYADALTDYVMLTVENNILSDNYNTNIYLDFSGYDMSVYINNNIIENSIFGYGLETTGNFLFTGSIEDNVIRNNNYDAIYMENYGDNIITMINNNTIKNNLYGYGIEIYCVYDVFATINDNQIISPYYDGVNIDSGVDINLLLKGNTITNSVNGYGVYLSATNAVTVDIVNNDISGNYYSNFYSSSQDGYFTMDGNDVSNCINEYGMQILSVFDLYLDMTGNTISNNYDDNIYIDVSSNWDAADITIQNNDISGSIWGNGIDIDVEYDVMALVESNDLSGNRYHNLDIFTTWGIIDAYVMNNDLGSGSILGKGIYLQAQFDVYAVINNNDLTGNYEENIYIRSFSGNGYLTLTDNIITNSVTRQGVYLYTYNDQIATIKSNDISGNYLSNVHLETVLNEFGEVSARITGNDLNDSFYGYGLYIYADDTIYNTIISNNRISGCDIDGIHLETNYYNWENIEITYNDITLNNNMGIYGFAGYEIYNLDISHNFIADNLNTGLYLENSYLAESITIISNTVIRNDGDGTYLFFGDNLQVGFEFTGNIIINNNGYGVFFREDLGGILGPAIFTNNQISNNLLGGLYVYVNTFCNIMIVNDNTFENNGQDAIYVHVDSLYINSVQIGRNTITGNDGYGIFLRGDGEVYLVEINDNVVSSSSGTGIYLQFNGIVEAIEVSRNSVISNSADGIELYSLGSVSNLIMNDNEITNINDEGIEITISDSSENIQIIRNIIDNTGNDGIYLDISSANALQINDNTLTNCVDYGVNLNSQYGIYNLQINGNILTNLNNSALYVDIGTDINILQINENAVENIALGYGIYIDTNNDISAAMICRNSVKNTYKDGIYLNILSDLITLQMNDNEVSNCYYSDYAGIYLNVGNGLSSSEFLRNEVTNVAQGIFGYGIYINVFGSAGQWSMNHNNVNQTFSGGIYFETGYADIVRFNDNAIYNTGNFGMEFVADSITDSISGFEFNRNTIIDTENGVYIYFTYEVYLVQINDNAIKNAAQGYGLYLENIYDLDLLEFRGNIVDNTGSGVHFNMDHAPETVTISENIISNTIWDYGIRLEILNSSGYVSNLEICDNQIVDTSIGMLVVIYCDVYTVQIDDNIIENTAWDHALYFVFYDWVGLYEMNDNYIDNSDKGIYLHFDLGVDEITMNANEISEVVNNYGLYLWAGANAVTSLQFNDNIVYNTARGVYMFFGDGIYAAKVESNIITNVAQDHGFFLESNDYVYLIQVNNNIIQNAYNNGLYLDLYGTNTSQVNDNTVINCGEIGIMLYSLQPVYGAEFNRNQVENARYGTYLVFDNNINSLQVNDNDINNINIFYGLYLYVNGMISNAQINSNNITNTNFEGMYLDFSEGPDVFQFSSNKIVNSASRGLYLSTGTSINVFTMKNNEITNNDGTGAHIQSSFGQTLKIENNNFSNNYGTNLYVRSMSGNIAATITNNMILNSMAGRGLELIASGELSADIENNQISNNYDRNLYVQSLGSGYYTIKNNALSNSIWDYGMYLEASNNIVASIDDNEVSNNYYSNVFITCDSGDITVFNNAFSSSKSTSGLEILANLDLDLDIQNNMISNNWDCNIEVYGSGSVQLILKNNQLLNADFGVKGTSNTDLNAIIQKNDIRNNLLGNIYLDSLSDMTLTISNNNLTGAFSGEGIYIDSGGTLGGVISSNNIRFNYNGIYMDVLNSGGVLDIYGNTISENLMFGLYANGGITGSFNDNTFFSNYLAVMIENTETPSLIGNSFSYNIYDIQLTNSNISINLNRFDNTTETCIQTLDSWPTIAMNHFENIGHELRYPPVDPQMVMNIRFSSGSMKYNPIPVSIVFNVIEDSMAESINTVNASINVKDCTFGYSPYSNLYAINSIVWVNESNLLSAIKIEDLETVVYIIDSEFNSDLVEYPNGDGMLVVGYTTDVKVLDQFGEAQVNLEINISSPNGWHTNGYTNIKGYFNGSVTIAYTQTASGKDYSMNPYNITVRDGAVLLFSLSFDVHGRSLKIIVLNDAPTMNLPLTINFNEDTQFKFNLGDYASDDGGLENLVFTYSGGTNITVTIDDNNIVTISSLVNWWGGPESITFRATDTLDMFTENSVNVSVVSVNDQPEQVAFLPDVTFNEDGKLSNAFDLDNYFTDVDSVLTFNVISTSNISINLDSMNNTVSFSAIANWCGVEYITFTASDGEFLLSDIIQVNVNSKNDAPMISSIATTIALESQQYTYDVDAIDVDEQYGDILAYALTTAPTGMTIDSVTGKITWTPSYEQALIGNFDITAVVTDSFGAFDTQSFVVDVNVDNEPPSISDIGITPLYPMEGDTIFAVPINWSDDQTPAAQAKYFYQWYRNGEPIYGATDSSLSSDHFVKGDIIAVEVMPYDGGKYGDIVTSQPVLVHNSPPSITNVVISPQYPTEIDDLTAIPIGFTDPDESDENEMYTYSWERDGIIISGVVENKLDSAYFEEGDVITVTVTPSDGEDNGPSRSSKDITILLDPTDSDGDGIPDKEDHHYIQRLDEDVDTRFDFDNDGVPDSNDVFPYDDTEWGDIDGDGEGDNTDHDKDGDGVPNEHDKFIFDSTEWVDSDHDGIGDNADSDDDNDNHPDISDAFPLDHNEFNDLDGDGFGDNTDDDIDGDGVLNTELNDDDDFPYNPLEQVDTDGDGIGNNADIDDDGDGVSDEKDYYPLDKNRSLDPLWWWWIVIALLLLILMIMVFLSRKQPGYEELPDDEFFLEEPSMLKKKKVVMKEKEERSKRSKVSETKRKPRKPKMEEPEEEMFEDEAEEFEEEEPDEFEDEFEEDEAEGNKGISEEKSKEDVIGEMLAEAESKVKELGFLGEGKEKVYTDRELKAMSKDELTRVAESMGLSISGTRFAILSRVMEDRRAADEGTGETEEAEGEVEQDIECPSCGKTFALRITERPVRIECPHCGVTGMIN